MQHKIFLLLISVCPIFGYSQSHISADSANKIIMNGGDCSDRNYTRVQTLPSLNISKQAFIDSISAYLRETRRSIEDGTIKLSFLVDCHSQIRDMRIVWGNTSYYTALAYVVGKSSVFWLPASQNNYIVSCYVILSLGFKNNALNNITILSGEEIHSSIVYTTGNLLSQVACLE
jgi:hypothetical protein